MRRTPFNDGWTVGTKANSFAEMIVGSGSAPAQVTLPHDAMIGTERSPAGHAATAYFPSGQLGVQEVVRALARRRRGAPSSWSSRASTATRGCG